MTVLLIIAASHAALVLACALCRNLKDNGR